MNIRQRLNPTTSTVPAARATGRPVFIDFTPTHSWRSDEQGSAVLVLALPGFTREQIKVTAEPSGNIIRIRGQRHVGGRNWSRFDSEFRVPEGCTMTGIRAKLELGNLYITIPNKNPSSQTQKQPKEDHQPRVTPLAQSAPRPLLSPTKPSQPQLVRPPSPGLPLPLPEQLLPQQLPSPGLPLPEQLQPQQLPSQVPPKQSETPPPEQSEPQLKHQERQPPTQPENALPQKTASDAPPVESEKMPPKSQPPPSERRLSSDEPEKEWENPERLAERTTVKGSSEKISKESSPARVGTGEKEMRNEELDAERGRETEALNIDPRRLSSHELLKFEDYTKMAKSKIREERQTLVNMCAAALVIAGLGFYICYNIAGKIHG